jgi:hypothetical protein
MGTIYLYANRTSEALRELELANALDSTNALVRGVLGYAYAVTGRAPRAREIAAQLEATVGRRNNAPAAAARVYLGLADTARALTLLERAAAEHDVSFSTEVLAEPFFDPVRHSPRFAAVVQMVGLDRALLR